MNYETKIESFAENKELIRELRNNVSEAVKVFLINAKMPQSLSYSTALGTLLENVVVLSNAFEQDPKKAMFALEKGFQIVPNPLEK